MFVLVYMDSQKNPVWIQILRCPMMHKKLTVKFIWNLVNRLGLWDDCLSFQKISTAIIELLPEREVDFFLWRSAFEFFIKKCTKLIDSCIIWSMPFSSWVRHQVWTFFAWIIWKICSLRSYDYIHDFIMTLFMINKFEHFFCIVTEFLLIFFVIIFYLINIHI